MTESDREQIARSVALEQAYVHEVYEQCAEKTAQSRHWPRIYQFLEELEPGALVCDIGCGNGKYLSVNHSIFKVGVDRCKRFTDIAREKENEVLICDNLALPFRDESFDAVLSIAVVHHFATTERRVHALKELARVLRIGGRLIISVWAMEQRHRKFESQDVLVPWPKAYCVNAMPDGGRYSGIPECNQIDPNQFVQKYSTTSKKNSYRKCKGKSYWIEPIFSPSPSTSSLSSPNETCYSFFRRALQKLAGGKRGSGNRPWFLEGWQSGSRHRKNYETDENVDPDDLPIELRGVEDGNLNLNKQSDSLSVKSKSVGDILEIQRLDLVRSRSSIPGLCSMLASDLNMDGESRASSSLSGSKPRLVKQKTHLIDDLGLENPENTAIQELSKDLPDFQKTPTHHTKRGGILKQSSMNEELMSTDRLEEKERVRRNIFKQASLNEELIYKGKTFESFKDTLYSGNATKRFQLLKSGLTNRIKQSTTNIEVSGLSIKNGFVRILQGWKSSESEILTNTHEVNDANTPKTQTNDKAPPLTPVKREAEAIERRLSREDGSDSSKDSSLQSDTSVDSEDSFASVIFVPKQEATPTPIAVSTPSSYQSGSASAPPSPRVKQSPEIPNTRIKLMPLSPLAKQFPAVSKILVPASPPGATSRTPNSSLTRPFSTTTPNQPAVVSLETPVSAMTTTTTTTMTTQVVLSTNCQTTERQVKRRNSEAELPDKIYFFDKKLSISNMRAYHSMGEPTRDCEPKRTDDKTPLISDDGPDNVAQEKTNLESIQEEESRTARLKQIKELLKQKPGFAMRTKPLFPLVRRASITNTTRLESMTKVLPKLLSLELFNPETDDLDSDSSGVSSPESVDSVISVISDERYTGKKDNTKPKGTESTILDGSDEKVVEPNKVSNNVQPQAEVVPKNDKNDKIEGEIAEMEQQLSESPKLIEDKVTTTVNSLEKIVEIVTENTHSEESLAVSTASSTQRNSIIAEGTKTKTITNKNITREPPTIHTENVDYKLPEVEDTWSEECRQRLIDFTEKLSENLTHETRRETLKIEYDQYDEPEESYLLRRKSDIKANRRSSVAKAAYEAARLASKRSGKFSDISNTIAWLRNSNNGFNGQNEKVPSEDQITIEVGDQNSNRENTSIHRSTSDDIMDFVMVSDTGECINEKESNSGDKALVSKPCHRSGNSIESSDIGESVENTVSYSDGSQGGSTGRLCSSMVSLLSNNTECSKTYAEKRKFKIQRRSASEEAPSRISDTKHSSECLVTTTTGSNSILSGSSSQESLPSDHGGGAITYHQYYHVFKEGELDQLINKYVENLHIISSYYDHASWCIVAEKVQVWTI